MGQDLKELLESILGYVDESDIVLCDNLSEAIILCENKDTQIKELQYKLECYESNSTTKEG